MRDWWKVIVVVRIVIANVAKRSVAIQILSVEQQSDRAAERQSNRVQREERLVESDRW